MKPVKRAHRNTASVSVSEFVSVGDGAISWQWKRRVMEWMPGAQTFPSPLTMDLNSGDETDGQDVG